MHIAQVSDFALTIDSSLCLLWPQTPEGHAWIEENVDPDSYQPNRSVTIIEHRYIGDIVNGIHDANLTIKDVIDTRKQS